MYICVGLFAERKVCPCGAWFALKLAYSLLQAGISPIAPHSCMTLQSMPKAHRCAGKHLNPATSLLCCMSGQHCQIDVLLCEEMCCWHLNLKGHVFRCFGGNSSCLGGSHLSYRWLRQDDQASWGYCLTTCILFEHLEVQNTVNMIVVICRFASVEEGHRGQERWCFGLLCLWSRSPKRGIIQWHALIVSERLVPC